MAHAVLYCLRSRSCSVRRARASRRARMRRPLEERLVHAHWLAPVGPLTRLPHGYNDLASSPSPRSLAACPAQLSAKLPAGRLLAGPPHISAGALFSSSLFSTLATGTCYCLPARSRDASAPLCRLAPGRRLSAPQDPAPPAEPPRCAQRHDRRARGGHPQGAPPLPCAESREQKLTRPAVLRRCSTGSRRRTRSGRSSSRARAGLSARVRCVCLSSTTRAGLTRALRARRTSRTGRRRQEPRPRRARRCARTSTGSARSLAGAARSPSSSRSTAWRSAAVPRRW